MATVPTCPVLLELRAAVDDTVPANQCLSQVLNLVLKSWLAIASRCQMPQPHFTVNMNRPDGSLSLAEC
jgi:hypothetical protein